MLQYLVIGGALLNLLGAVAYIRDTLQGKTKPNRVTWSLWAAVPMIAVAAAVSDGVTWAIVPVFMSGVNPLLIFSPHL